MDLHKILSPGCLSESSVFKETGSRDFQSKFFFTKQVLLVLLEVPVPYGDFVLLAHFQGVIHRSVGTLPGVAYAGEFNVKQLEACLSS